MLAGDFGTMPLQDLLQWVEQAQHACVIAITQETVTTRIQVHGRRVVAISDPPEFAAAAVGDRGTRESTQVIARLTAEDRLLDLFLSPAGRFEVLPYASWERGTPVDIALRVLVMEGLRHLDEWPRLQQLYTSDAARLAATGVAPTRNLGPVLRGVLACAGAGLSLGDARVRLGLSRPAMLRRVEELRGMGLCAVDGTDAGPDPVARLLAQAGVLVAERQFEEAAIVFQGLLAADPTDARVRRLLAEAEREHVAALYQELDPLRVPVLRDAGSLPSRRLSRAEREVVDRINGRWDVASVVLSSPLREVETLKSLRKLVRMELVSMVSRSAVPGA